MNLSVFFDELDLNKCFWAAKYDLDTEVFSFQTFFEGTEYLTNTVYIGEFIHLPNSAPDNTVFICSNKSQFSRSVTLSNCNLVFTDEDLLNLIHKISIIFSSEQKLKSDMCKLTNVLEGKDCLPKLVDTAYEMLGNPISIIDSSYKILAMSKKRVDSHSIFEEQRDLGYLSSETIASLKRDKIYDKIRRNESPHYSVEKNSNLGWLVGLAYVSNIEAAEVAIMELNRPFTSYDHKICHHLCKLVSLELQKDIFYRQNHSLMHSIFLSDLLEERIQDMHNAKIRMNQLGWKLGDKVQLLMIFDRNFGVFDYKAQLICQQVQTILPSSRWVIHEDSIIFLVPIPDSQSSHLDLDLKLSEYLKNNNLTAALSEEFASVLSLKKHYKQCEIAHRLGIKIRPDSILYRYSDFLLNHIGLIISKNASTNDYCHPAIIKIANYDEANNSNLLETLELYLLYVDDPTSAAKCLNIHKNTLFYRINKIKEQFNLNLSNGYERAKLMISLVFVKMEN